MPLPRKRSPDGATTDCCGGHPIAAYYSFIDPGRMKYKVEWNMSNSLPVMAAPF